jgi:signal transduction histidine kinase
MKRYLHALFTDRKNVVRGLQIGFGLVLVLLFLAGTIAVLEVQEMHVRKSTLAEQQQVLEHSELLAFESVLLIGACLLIAAASALATVSFVKESMRQQQQQQDELTQVSWHMLQTQEQTARRFAHEMHDELGQVLAALRSNVTKGTTSPLDPLRQDCLQLVDGAIANVRELSQLLRPVILDDFGLDSALRWLIDGFAQRTRLQVDYDSDCEERLGEETETHLFRIAQEALTNIARHADAKGVTIQLRCTADSVSLSIADDGRGLSFSDERPSLGMVGMKARARQCGGELILSQVLPHGTSITAVVPRSVRSVGAD